MEPGRELKKELAGAEGGGKEKEVEKDCYHGCIIAQGAERMKNLTERVR